MVLRALIFSLLAWLFPLDAAAQVLWSDVDEVIEVQVRPGWRTSQGRHIAALEFRLAPGWKTYWRSPGAAGIAPMVSWAGSDNLDAVAVHWPTPQIGRTGDAVTLGYFDRFVLPLELTPSRADGVIKLRGRLDIGVCADICIPARLRVAADLPVVGTQDAAISAALEGGPKRGHGTVRCRLRPTQDGFALTARLPLARPLGNAEAVAVELAQARGRILTIKTEVKRQGRDLMAETQFMIAKGGAMAINRADLRFTAVGARGAVEWFGCAAE